MTDSELETLAQLLAGLGITLNLTDAEGHLLISAPATRRESGTELPRTVSMNLADGRRLVLAPDTEIERRNAEARQRFRVLAEHSSDLIVAVDADLAIRFASQAAATLLDLVPEERCLKLKGAYLALRRRVHELALDDGGRVVPDAELEAVRAFVSSVWHEVFGGVEGEGEQAGAPV